jgi:FtsH-binding integral membrane protein
MGFRHEWLNETFWMMSLGMGIVAIGSGALANLLVEREGVGARAPSFAAAVVSTVCFLIIKSTWVENVGVRHISLSRPILNAFQALQEKSVALLGWAQACFDLAVAIFWLLWIPTLVVSFMTSSLDVTAVSCTILS